MAEKQTCEKAVEELIVYAPSDNSASDGSCSDSLRFQEAAELVNELEKLDLGPPHFRATSLPLSSAPPPPPPSSPPPLRNKHLELGSRGRLYRRRSPLPSARTYLFYCCLYRIGVLTILVGFLACGRCPAECESLLVQDVQAPRRSCKCDRRLVITGGVLWDPDLVRNAVL